MMDRNQPSPPNRRAPQPARQPAAYPHSGNVPSVPAPGGAPQPAYQPLSYPQSPGVSRMPAPGNVPPEGRPVQRSLPPYPTEAPTGAYAGYVPPAAAPRHRRAGARMEGMPPNYADSYLNRPSAAIEPPEAPLASRPRKADARPSGSDTHVAFDPQADLPLALEPKPRKRWLIPVCIAALLAAALLLFVLLRPRTAAPTEAPVVFAETEIRPATASGSVTLLAFSADNASAQPPATLTFTLDTSAGVSAVRLLNQSGAALSASSQSAPYGDGLRWQCAVVFDAPYQGAIRAFLRDANGAWTEGGLRCDISLP